MVSLHVLSPPFQRESNKGETLSVSAFSTCFVSAEKVINCFAGHLSDILERFNQIPLEHQDFRKVFDHPQLSLLKPHTNQSVGALFILVNNVTNSMNIIYK